MTLEAWLLFCGTEAVLSFLPGPAVLLVVSVALTRGARAGLASSLGILAANVFYFALSATSLGALLLASWEMFSLVKWLGAAYLVWIGLHVVLSAFGRPEAGAPTPHDTPGRGDLGSFGYGFVTQAANPKSLLFFTAILPQFIDPAEPVARQIAILGASSVLIELGVLSLHVAACRQARGWASALRLAAPLQAVGGGLLVVAGARLAALRRD
jgi:threonine/homoserine/homoserine lactone efflux protein